jgi:hypothetical protein
MRRVRRDLFIQLRYYCYYYTAAAIAVVIFSFIHSFNSWIRMRAYPAHTERKGPTRQTPEPSPRMHGFYIRTLAHAQPPHALLLGPTHLTRANQTTCRCSRSPKSPRRLRCSHNGRRLGIQGETLEVETAPPPNADTSLATVRESSSSHFPYAQLSGALKKGYGCVLVLGRLGYVAAIFAVARRGADLGAQKARMWLCNAAVRYVVSYAVETHRAKSNLKCAVKSQYLRPGPCARLPHRTRLTTRRSRSTRCNHARSLHLCPALGRRPPRIRSTVGACSGGTSRSRTAHTPRLRTWSTRASQSTRGKRRRRSSHIALGAAGPSVLRPPSASARAAPREPLLTRVAPMSLLPARRITVSTEDLGTASFVARPSTAALAGAVDAAVA